MLYRLDRIEENSINPITGKEYDGSWIILILTDSEDYQHMCGSTNGCAYTIRVSRLKFADWKMAVGDFMGFSQANGKNAILVIADDELKSVKSHYGRHKYNDCFLRDKEPPVLVHSTSAAGWELIKKDGMLKSWNKLKAQNSIAEEQPIGIRLGDPEDFSDYIMFGSGITGEIVVNSRQKGVITMDENDEYLTGARLYFDAKKIAEEGMLIRDGCHLKVKDMMPLTPYLIWAATWDNIGLSSSVSTPKIFADKADKQFQALFSNI